MDKSKIQVSIIMPALNEEDNIEEAIKNALESFEDYGLNGEIIVVNDGSRDTTQDRVQGIMQKDSRVRMIKHASCQGLGASFWDGLDAANGLSVVVLPGDNENFPGEILRYYTLLEHVDIVIPFVLNREVRPALRNLLSSLYRFVINTTFVTNFNYTNGTVLYRKLILNEIRNRNKGLFFQTDILIRLVKKGYLFAEVPYRLGVRKEGVSKAISLSSLLKIVKGYLHLLKDYYLKTERHTRAQFLEDSLTSRRRNS
jgi:glycosyltransferase involved in cell wall biosynthesis